MVPRKVVLPSFRVAVTHPFNFRQLFRQMGMVLPILLCPDELVHDFYHLVDAVQLRGEANNVAEMFFSAATSNKLVLTHGGADPAHFVGRDTHARTYSTHKNPDVELVLRHGESHRAGDVRPRPCTIRRTRNPSRRVRRF